MAGACEMPIASMAADCHGHPAIANCFCETRSIRCPQYHRVIFSETAWFSCPAGQRTLNFHRQEGGTKQPPISRPFVRLDSKSRCSHAYVVFLGKERGDQITIAADRRLEAKASTIPQLTAERVGQADPIIDPVIREHRKQVHLLHSLLVRATEKHRRRSTRKWFQSLTGIRSWTNHENTRTCQSRYGHQPQ